MDARIANAFMTALVDTFKKETNIDFKRYMLTKKEILKPTKPICIDIGITGEIRGKVIYSMDDLVAYEITKSMLKNFINRTNLVPAEIRKLTPDAIAELANIITGQAGTKLSEGNINIDITPPTIYLGIEKVEFWKLDTLCISMMSTIGSMEINLAVWEG